MAEHDAGASSAPPQDSRLLRVLADQLPAMLAYWDANERCLFANRAYETWFGVKPESIIGRKMEDFLGPLYRLNLPYIQGALRGEEQEFEREIPDPAGGPARHSQAHYIPHVVDGSVRGFSVLVVDITRRARAEEALHQAERRLQATERVAALATLASGIAHEINNPLAAVLANIECTLADLDRGQLDPATVRAALVEARDAARRVRDIVQRMKLLVRGEGAERERVDVDEVLAQSVGVASNAIRYRARVVRELGHVGCVEGHASTLAQVFVSLLVNAAQALPEEGAARNEIRLVSRREGDQIVVEVGDNGCGIPEEMQSRIFDPFFTTKEVGGGMGLGLSISSGIVHALGGSISLTSKVGEGSVFRVVLPAAAAPRLQVEPPVATATERSVSPELGARVRVLVVDDEPMLTRVLERALGKLYDVTVTNDGRDAVARLCAEGADVDVILCDVMMPEVSGPDVYAEVVAKRPELAERFVFMTGGAFTPRTRAFVESMKVPVLPKPFDLAVLTEVVASRARKRTTPPLGEG